MLLIPENYDGWIIELNDKDSECIDVDALVTKYYFTLTLVVAIVHGVRNCSLNSS